MPRRHTAPAVSAPDPSFPLTTGTVVVIDATPVPASLTSPRLDQVELSVDVTVLAAHLAPRRTRACLVVDQEVTPRIHPGAELAVDLTIDGDLVTLHIPNGPTTSPAATRVPVIETVTDTTTAGRQS